MEKVFDQYGKEYSLKDLLVDNEDISQGRSTLIVCSATSIFNLYFEPGCGMENTTITAHNERRAVVCRVYQDISNFINTPLTTTGKKVNIWVRNINNVITSPNGVLGLASGFYVLPSNSIAGTGGIADNEIWKTIHTGVDSYTNVTPPLSSTGGGSNFYHGMITFNFNTTPAINWNTSLTATTIPTTTFDLYSAVLHEVTHALGFVSLIDQNGNSTFGPNFRYYSRYDRFLRTNDNVALITNSTACSTMYNNVFNSSLNTSVLHPDISSCIANTTNCINAIKFVGTSTVPVYTPNCFEPISSLSHFEDMHFPTCNSSLPNGDNYFLMCNAGNPGIIRRYLRTEERKTLCDIGYSVKTTFGVSTTFGGVPPAGYYGITACGGISVSGVNDGITTAGTYAFIGTASATPNITISGATILLNDIFPSGTTKSFECLQDISFPSTLSATSGNTTTNVQFNSTVAGLHLLRYVPLSSTGQRGNITYVYVFVRPANPVTCNATPNVCNLVSNGNFEQNVILPNAAAQPIITDNQLERACGWFDVHVGSADYHFVNPLAFQIGVPCNMFGNQPDRIAGNQGYIGMSINRFAGAYYDEMIGTTLATPLLANTSYQLSFDVSLGDFMSSRGYRLQFLLRNTAIISNPLANSLSDAEVGVANAIFVTSPTFSTNNNGWETITFNFTTGPTAGHQFLYLGGLNYSAFAGSPATAFTTLTPSTLASCTSPPNTYNNTSATRPNSAYYYIDNVNLIPLNGAIFNLPATIACPTNSFANLTTFLTGVPTNGVFTGQGVVLNAGIYSFNSGIAGVGNITINYTYNNNLGCPITISDTINVITAGIVPQFNFPTIICRGTTAPVLPLTSLNGIAGTWSSSTIATATHGIYNYVFTPTNTTLCSTTLVLPITIIRPRPAMFAILNDLTLCENSTPPVLPTVSDNGFTGTWSPSVISTTLSGNYTFYPSAGQCSTGPINFPVIVVASNAFVSQNDIFITTFPVTNVQTLSVLNNDTYNGGSIPPTIVNLPYSIVLTGSLPTFATGAITLNITTGIFTILANTTPGTYYYTYYIHNNCFDTAIATATITISNYVAGSTKTDFKFCYNSAVTSSTSSTSNSSGGTSLFDGFTIQGLPVNPSNATIVMVSPTSTALLPIPIQIQANGTFIVPAGTLPNNIQFYYKIVDNATGNSSADISCSIQVHYPFMGNFDNLTTATNGTINYNVLSNDTQYNCTTGAQSPLVLSNVILTQVPPFNSFYSINTITGEIVYNQTGGFAPAGSYIISYQLCDVTYSTLCLTVLVYITVPSTIRSGFIFTNEVFDIEKTTVSPNPTNEKITITFNTTIATDFKLELYDVLGRLLIEKQILKDSLHYELDLSHYCSANYFLKITDILNGSNFDQTIIKK